MQKKSETSKERDKTYYILHNCGDSILQYMKDNSVEFRILEEPLLVTGLGIAFAKNDSRGLDIQLNAVLAQMRTDGTLEQILGKYLEHASQYLEVDTIGT